MGLGERAFCLRAERPLAFVDSVSLGTELGSALWLSGSFPPGQVVAEVVRLRELLKVLKGKIENGKALFSFV